MPVRRKKAWYVVAGGVLGAILAVIMLFKEFAWALPWTAASKIEVQTLHHKVSRIEGKIDALLEGCDECPEPDFPNIP